MLRPANSRGTMVLFALLMSMAAPATLAAQGPDYFNYQIAFPGPPANGIAALDELNERAKRALTAVACGVEFRFLDLARSKGTNEDITNIVIGKMDWYGGHADQNHS